MDVCLSSAHTSMHFFLLSLNRFDLFPESIWITEHMLHNTRRSCATHQQRQQQQLKYMESRPPVGVEEDGEGGWFWRSGRVVGSNYTWHAFWLARASFSVVSGRQCVGPRCVLAQSPGFFANKKL